MSKETKLHYVLFNHISFLKSIKNLLINKDILSVIMQMIIKSKRCEDLNLKSMKYINSDFFRIIIDKILKLPCFGNFADCG